MVVLFSTCQTQEMLHSSIFGRVDPCQTSVAMLVLPEKYNIQKVSFFLSHSLTHTERAHCSVAEQAPCCFLTHRESEAALAGTCSVPLAAAQRVKRVKCHSLCLEPIALRSLITPACGPQPARLLCYVCNENELPV